jgi:hypothetical protein
MGHAIGPSVLALFQQGRATGPAGPVIRPGFCVAGPLGRVIGPSGHALHQEGHAA